jgi:hypothetical protein
VASKIAKARRTCRKKRRKGNVYASRDSACWNAAKMRRETGNQEIHAYQCSACRKWHLGTLTNGRAVQVQQHGQTQPDQSRATMSQDILNEIERYDRDYQPAERQQQLPSDRDLEDGIGVFAIRSADLVRTANSREAILRVILYCEQGRNAGITCERAYFFRDQNAIDRLGADLLTLGFAEFNQAKDKRPFSAKLGLAVTKMAGLRVQYKKRTHEGKGYCDFAMIVTGSSPAAQPPRPTTPSAQQRSATAPLLPPTSADIPF